MATLKAIDKPETTETPSAELVLAARYRREFNRTMSRAYKRAVRTFAEDASCSEEVAAAWLQAIGVVEPTNGK